MTDPVPQSEPKKEKSDVEQLRDEFSAQFATLKQSFETELNNLKTENDQLKQTNDELKRALVRSAITPAPAHAEPEKSEEELYHDQIDALAKKTLARMSTL